MGGEQMAFMRLVWCCDVSTDCAKGVEATKLPSRLSQIWADARKMDRANSQLQFLKSEPPKKLQKYVPRLRRQCFEIWSLGYDFFGVLKFWLWSFALGTVVAQKETCWMSH